jgi:hypothetical protein
MKSPAVRKAIWSKYNSIGGIPSFHGSIWPSTAEMGLEDIDVFTVHPRNIAARAGEFDPETVEYLRKARSYSR